MANFTVTTNTNWDSSSFSTRTGNDNYTITGATLTIDTDTRYCANATATTGNFADITITSTVTNGKVVIDGTNVRLIAYTTGSGNVPAIGTTVTNSSGGITGYLLGVWSALNAAPTAAGAAMPASGYIKIKNATGSFTSGALSGIGATSSGADVAGWIEVVGIDGKTLTIPRLGHVDISGAWFEAGTTSGSANQSIQLPASLTNTYYPGVWIETGVGSDVYEFYGNVGSSTTVFATDSTRGKIVWISSQGVVTIAKTSFGGYTPTSGLKIRVPNILLITCTSGAPTANSYNSTPSSRYKFSTISSGSLSITKAISTWYNSFTSPYDLSLNYVGFLDSFITSSIVSSVAWDNVCVGIGTNINILTSTQISTCLFGGTVINSSFIRVQYGNPATNSPSLTLTSVFDFTFTNCKFYAVSDRTSASSATALSQTSGSNIIFDSCTCIGGMLSAASIISVVVQNLIYCDLISGDTTSSNALSACVFNKCTDPKLDGITFGGLTNAHPYDSIVAARDNIDLIIRNIGTSSSKLSLGSANSCNTVCGGSVLQQSGNSNIKMQRVYVTNLRSGKLMAQLPGDSVITIENCWGENTNTFPTGSQNVTYKGLFTSTTIPTSFTSIYGTHFFDTYTSTTAGLIGLFMTEPSLSTTNYVSSSITSTTSGFTGTGLLILGTTNDVITYTWSYYILGYTSFSAVAPTVTGTNSASNHKYEYDIDKNDANGFSGAFKNFYLQKTGGATTSGNAIVTMTSTTGIAVNDRIYGTNITAGTYVVSVDSATQCTMSANSTGTGSSLTFVVSALNSESSISASLGFKLKIKITCTTGNSSNTISGCYCQGTTDATSQDTNYPLDLSSISITVQDAFSSPVQNARVAVYKISDNTELMNSLTDVNGLAEAVVSYSSDIPVYIRVRKSSTGTTRYVNNNSVGTITSIGLTSTIVLLSDAVATP